MTQAHHKPDTIVIKETMEAQKEKVSGGFTPSQRQSWFTEVDVVTSSLEAQGRKELGEVDRVDRQELTALLNSTGTECSNCGLRLSEAIVSQKAGRNDFEWFITEKG